MSFFDVLRGKRAGAAPEQRALAETGTLTSPGLGLFEIFGGLPDASGVAVTPFSAMRSPTFAACVRAISETVGQLPIAYRVKQGAGWRKVADAPAAKVLNGFANPWTDGAQLRTQLTKDAMLYRFGGFARVIRVRGEVREIHRLRPSLVTVLFDEFTGEPSYRFNGPQGAETLAFNDVIHITPPGWTIELAHSVLDHCRDVVSLDLAMAHHQTSVFGSGGLPKIVLSPGRPNMSDDALLKALAFLKKQANRSYGDPLILPEAFSQAFQSFGLDSMQFLELRRLVIEEIARAARVPSTVIGDLSRGTYANLETQNRQFLQLSLLPWLEVWEGALTRCLIPSAERLNTEFEFVVEDLLRGDIASRYTAYRAATGGSWLTPNEVRELDGRQPVPEGDELIKQAGQSGAKPPTLPQSAAEQNTNKDLKNGP